MKLVYSKSFRVVSLILAIIFTAFIGYLIFNPQVLPFSVNKSILILFIFYSLFALVHNIFSLFNNGFMQSVVVCMGAIVHLILFIFALFSTLWFPLIFIFGIIFLVLQILIYSFWPPDKKIIQT